MSDDSARCDAVAGQAADTGTPAPHVLFDIVRRLRARERGYLAGLLHDGPIQELAVASLELAQARRAMGASPGEEVGVAAQQVDAAGRSLRSLQDELWPFPRPASGLASALSRRTGWLLAAPLAVDAGEGAAGLLEAEIQVVADVVELILGGLAGAEATERALVAVRADENLIFLELSMTPAPGSGPASGGPAAARASLRSLAAAMGAGADVGPHGSRLRVRMDIPRQPRHESGLDAAASVRM